MRPEQKTTPPVNPHVQIMDLVLFGPKPYFRVVKHARRVHQVKLGIFLPHLHIKFVRLELRLFSYELNHVNMA